MFLLRAEQYCVWSLFPFTALHFNETSHEEGIHGRVSVSLTSAMFANTADSRAMGGARVHDRAYKSAQSFLSKYSYVSAAPRVNRTLISCRKPVSCLLQRRTHTHTLLLLLYPAKLNTEQHPPPQTGFHLLNTSTVTSKGRRFAVISSSWKSLPGHVLKGFVLNIFLFAVIWLCSVTLSTHVSSLNRKP